MKKLGFTLAEVLITLVIIGVIAAMTIPTLMVNTQGQEYRAALKKAFSTLNQALTLNYALTGNTAQDYTATTIVSNLFAKRMAVSTTGAATKVFTTKPTGEPIKCGEGKAFATTDGMLFCVDTTFAKSTKNDASSPCDIYNNNPCTENGAKNVANLWIDVNGKRPPNAVTTQGKKPKDIYQGVIYAQKIVPYGAPTQQVLFDEGLDRQQI